MIDVSRKLKAIHLAARVAPYLRGAGNVVRIVIDGEEMILACRTGTARPGKVKVTDAAGNVVKEKTREEFINEQLLAMGAEVQAAAGKVPTHCFCGRCKRVFENARHGKPSVLCDICAGGSVICADCGVTISRQSGTRQIRRGLLALCKKCRHKGFSACGSSGGLSAAAAMTPGERSERARNASRARWGK